MKKNYGVDCLVNSQQTKIVIKEIDDNNYSDSKYMFIDYGLCKQGETITVDDITWMLVQQEESFYEAYDKFTIQKVNHITNFIIDEEVEPFPSLFNVGSQSVDESKYFDIVGGTLKLIIPSSTLSNKIKVNDRLIKFQNAWKIVAITNENEGLLCLYTNKDSVSSDDDLIDEIPEGADDDPSGWDF